MDKIKISSLLSNLNQELNNLLPDNKQLNRNIYSGLSDIYGELLFYKNEKKTKNDTDLEMSNVISIIQESLKGNKSKKLDNMHTAMIYIDIKLNDVQSSLKLLRTMLKRVSKKLGKSLDKN